MSVTVVASVNFERFMKFYMFKDFCRIITCIWEDDSIQVTEVWWKFQPAVDEFNEIRRTRIVSDFWMIVDELMSAWRPRTSATGHLPNISYILQKPENLGKLNLCLFLLLLSCPNSYV